MIERYKQLYSELKLLEYQLKDKCKVKFGKDIAGRMLVGKKTFINPEAFIKILGEKE